MGEYILVALDELSEPSCEQVDPKKTHLPRKRGWSKLASGIHATARLRYRAPQSLSRLLHPQSKGRIEQAGELLDKTPNDEQMGVIETGDNFL